MTEQEIIGYLKNNQTNGVAYGFMPDEVQDWVEIHPATWFRVYIQTSSTSHDWKMIGNKNTEFSDTDIIMLPVDFVLPSSIKKGHWDEFDIDEDGNFVVYDNEVNGIYRWYQWWNVLNDKRMEYTAFGGWFYEGNGSWWTMPMLNPRKDDKQLLYRIEDNDAKDSVPAIPIKIRFWREIK